MAQRPQPVGVFAGRAIGDAGFTQMPVGGAETALDFSWRQACEGIEKPRPDRARRAILRDVFIGNSGQADVIARPLRHAPVGRAALGSLTARPAFLAFVSRHADSPARRLFSM